MLVTKAEEIKSVFPNNTFDKFEKLRVYMNTAERTQLMPVLGLPLYERLDSIHAAPEGESVVSEYATLLELVQTAIVQFGIWKALPMLNVVINQAGGLTVTTNDNQVAASKDRTDKLMASLEADAWDSIDTILEYLERNSRKFVDDSGAELWKQSDWYWQQVGHLIFTAAEFEQAGIFIEKKRRTFIRLLPSMRTMEVLYIRAAIGYEQTTELITRKRDNELTPADREVLPLLQTALAHYTAASDRDLCRPESTHGSNAQEYASIASKSLSMAVAYMRAHPADFPAYPGNQPSATEVKPRRSTDDDPCLIMGAFDPTANKHPDAMFRFDTYMEQWASRYKPMLHTPENRRFFREDSVFLLGDMLNDNLDLTPDMPCCGIVTHIESVANVRTRTETRKIEFLFFRNSDPEDPADQAAAKAECHAHGWKFLLHLQHDIDAVARSGNRTPPARPPRPVGGQVRHPRPHRPALLLHLRHPRRPRIRKAVLHGGRLHRIMYLCIK